MFGKQHFVSLMLRDHLCFILNELLNDQNNSGSAIWIQADEMSAILIFGIFCMEHKVKQRVRLMRRQWNPKRQVMEIFPWLLIMKMVTEDMNLPLYREKKT